MSTEVQTLRPNSQALPTALLDILRNTLILNHLSPYLHISDLLSLASTSREFKDLIYGTPSVFRYLDLSHVYSCYAFHKLNNTTKDGSSASMTTDEFYARPLRRVFHELRGRSVLQDVRSLILDRLPVPLPLLQDILCDDAFNIRILSLRGAKELGDEKLIQLLRYIIRPSRPQGTPKLKGLYYFTPQEASADFMATNLIQRAPGIGITNALGAQLGADTSMSSGALHRQLIKSSWHQYNAWYGATGQVLKLGATLEDQWALLLKTCEGLIAFDAVLCRQAPNHSNAGVKLATVSLGGCQICGSCPEGPAFPGVSAQNELPLLAPLPMHQSSVKTAQRLGTSSYPHPPLIVRCRTCLKDRWCERCNIWWCECCYTIPSKRGRACVSQAPGANEPSIKVHNNLCVSKCLMDEMLNGVGEGGMWG